MKRSENFHYRWVRDDYVKGDPEPERDPHPSEKLVGHLEKPTYHLGQSNLTAKSKGGFGICVFRAKDGIILSDSDKVEANQLVWVINPVSDQENYCKYRVRSNAKYKVSLAGFPTALTSINYDYDIVKKIALKLVQVCQEILSRPIQKNQVWKTLKSEFDIASYVESLNASVSVSIAVDPIRASNSN